MLGSRAWREVESEVHRPGRWIVSAVGAVFLLLGCIGFATIGGLVPPGIPFWIAKACTATFALLGGTALAWGLGSIVSPTRIRHAAPDVLPEVPRDPVIREGSIVHGRLTHELSEDDDGWQLRPAKRHWRNDRIILLGFGVPFLVFFAGILTWTFHSQLNLAGWVVSAILAIAVTLACGGTAFVLIAMLMRASYRQLSSLSIPHHGGDLELDSPREPDVEHADVAEGLRWAFSGETQRRRLTISRDLVAAVQLCPWKFTTQGGGDRSTTWAVQGLLVLASAENAAHCRVPLLLTGDFVRAARLMQRLARTLDVPYLFCADAEGWKAESIRAKQRPPLRMGGSMS